MTTPVILKSHSGADFLAMLPTLCGFIPHDSVLIVPFHGTRTMGVMRMDLPPVTARGTPDAFCAVALAAMSRLSRCDGVALAVYADEPFTVAYAAWEALIDALAERFRSAGFAVKDTLCAAADGWASWQETDAPIAGHPLSDVCDSPLTAQTAAIRGGAAVPPHDTGGRLPPTDAARLARVSECARMLVRTGRIPHARVVPSSVRPTAAAGVVERMLRCAGADGMPESLMAQLAVVGMSDDDRDEALIRIAFGRKTARRLRAGRGRPPWRSRRANTPAATPAGAAAGSAAFATGAAGPGASDAAASGTATPDPATPGTATSGPATPGTATSGPEAVWPETVPGAPASLGIHALLLGLCARTPDADAMRHALVLLGHVAAHLEPPLRPGVLCMLAWLHWALGSGSRAGRHVDEALRIDPDHRMAVALRALVGSGTLPEWVYALHDAAVGRRDRGTPS